LNRRALVAEFIGTFFLVLTIGLVVIDPGVPAGFAPVAIGSVLTAMIYATGYISGAHFNPAVTFAFFLRNKIAPNDAIAYWVTQLLAAVVAALVVGLMKPALPAEAMFGSVDVAAALLAELLFTFALVFVILNVATAKATEGNLFYGWAIGLIVLGGIYAVGGISGAAYNPAVVVGGSMMRIFAWGNIWLYLLAEFVGGAAVAYTFRFTHPGE
jgi:aquaporin Z